MSHTLEALKRIEDRERTLDGVELFVFPALPMDPEDSPQSPETKVKWPCRPLTHTSYERLAATLLAQRAVGRAAALLVTSPDDGDGKTGLLLALAPLLAARAGRGVLVADADFRKGDLTARLAVCNDGLAGLLADTAIVADVVRPTTTPLLSFLPLGQCTTSGCGRFGFSALETVLDDLKSRYPLVLLDTPSLVHPNVAAMGSSCDAVLLVVRPGRTRHRAVREAVELVGTTGGRLLGCIAIGE